MNKYICPHCEKEFPLWYWGVTGKMGGCGTVRKPGLAKANYDRHVKACKRKERLIILNMLLRR